MADKKKKDLKDIGKNKMAKKKPGPATQRYLDIVEIRDDMVVMKDGTVRAVLLVSSINFALKSADEQEAIVQSYITFLNSLQYPLQICIQSRQMNIDSYLASLDETRKKTSNELLKNQIDDYKNFISELLELGEIMQKRFYVVVPYDPVTDQKRGLFARFGEALSPAVAAKLNKKQYSERLELLARRTETVSGLLTSIGLTVARLDTQSLVELYYGTYNPNTFASQKLTDIEEMGIDTQSI